MLFTPSSFATVGSFAASESPDLTCHECWDEEYWSEMTDEEWEELYQKSFYEGIGGD